MTLRQRIKEAREAKGLSQAGLARLQGRTRNAVSQWENGTSQPSSEQMRKLAVNLDVDFEWLTTGRKRQTVPLAGLPLHGSVAAGVWREVGESQDMNVVRVPVSPDSRWPIDAQYALRVEGNSVNRIAADGTILHCVDVIDGNIQIRSGDLVVVERRHGHTIETTVKRAKLNARKWELWPESDDPRYQAPVPYVKDGGDVVIKALVISVTTPIARGAA